MTPPHTEDTDDDDARLAALATALADAVEGALPGWVAWVVAERSPAPLDPAVVAGTAEAVWALVGPLRDALSRDVDVPGPSPLAVLRSGIVPVTTLLDGLGVAHRQRDDQQIALFPDDRHDLVPASFADLSEAAGELGLAWGAARAWVHLRRHREGSPA